MDGNAPNFVNFQIDLLHIPPSSVQRITDTMLTSFKPVFTLLTAVSLHKRIRDAESASPRHMPA